jgi:DNA-binding MarR family transcriptional regulator
MMDSLRILEKQSGFLRLLVYLYENGEKPLTAIMDETGIPVHQLYASIRKAEELGLVKTRIDDGKYPPRSIVSLTKRGKKVAERILEIREFIDNGRE